MDNGEGGINKELQVEWLNGCIGGRCHHATIQPFNFSQSTFVRGNDDTGTVQESFEVGFGGFGAFEQAH